MEILDLDRAEYELNKAYKLNPTPWANHSRYVAKAARIISSEYNKKLLLIKNSMKIMRIYLVCCMI